MDKSIELPVLYRDEHIIVIDKPIDLPVHKNDFMANDAPYLTKLVGDMTGRWILNVHRLDAKTSGVIILAFTKDCAHHLALQFEEKKIGKTYYALVQGNPGEGEFDRKVLVKKKSKFKKPALTRFKTLRTVSTGFSYKEKKDVQLSLVEINPETGRWHQLRQHFAQHRYDILGDSHHGDFTLNKMVSGETGIKRLFLHAGEISLTHPETEERMKFAAPMPESFSAVLDYFS